jgi:hypothetical protein
MQAALAHTPLVPQIPRTQAVARDTTGAAISRAYTSVKTPYTKGQLTHCPAETVS